MHWIQDIQIEVQKDTNPIETWEPTPFHLERNLNKSLVVGSGNLVLTQDIVIKGNYKQVGGTLDLNGHQLKIEGDFQQDGGVVLLNKGQLDIQGNFVLSTNGTGMKTEMKLQNEEDRLIVQGSFSSGRLTQLTLEKGLIEVKGDFSLAGGQVEKGDTARIVLNGTARQLIHYEESPYNNPQVEIWNPNIAIAENENYVNLILHTDVVLQEAFIFHNGIFDLNKHTLTIGGDLNQVEGQVLLNGGKLFVNGNYTFGMIDDSPYDKSGLIEMHTPDDYIHVAQNFVVQGKIQKGWNLTDGVIDVKGDALLNSGSFNTQDHHRLVLSGDQQQLFSIAYPEQTEFAILEFKNNRILLDDPNHLVISNKGLKIEQLIAHDFVVPNLTVDQYSSFTLGGDMTVSGNVTLQGGLHLNGHTQTIQGNFTARGGYVKFDGGKLIVGGDFTSEPDQDDNDFMTLGMNTAESELRISGNYHASASVEGGGLIEIKGDLSKRLYKTDAVQDLRVVLSGIRKQTLSGNITTDILELDNASGEGVHFADDFDVNVQKLFLHRNQAVYKQENEWLYTFPDYDQDGLKDHLDPDPMSPADDVLDLKYADSNVRNQVIYLSTTIPPWKIQVESVDGIVVLDREGTVVARCRAAEPTVALFFEPVTTGMQENQTYRLIIPKDIIRVNGILKNKAYDIEFVAQGDSPPPDPVDVIDLFDIIHMAKTNPQELPQIIQQYGNNQ